MNVRESEYIENSHCFRYSNELSNDFMTNSRLNEALLSLIYSHRIGIQSVG